MGATPSSFATNKNIGCPFAIKWKIGGDKLAALKNSENEYLDTKWFNASNIPDVKYQLRIYPNGNIAEQRGKVWICLQLKIGTQKKVKADFKVCIESANGIYHFNHEFVGSWGYGGTRFTTTDLFDPEKKLIVNGKLIIKCQGILTVERKCQSADVGNKWNEQSFLGKLWKRSDKDFTIVVDGKKIKAHKHVLGTCSKYFSGMFNSGMNEASGNKMDITYFSYETVKIALKLMYEQNISTLTLEEKMDVLHFFDKYRVQDLKDSLEASLVENISPSSVVFIANSSIVAKSTNLQQRSHDFMVACFAIDQNINYFDNLDNDIALKIVKNTFYTVIET